MRARPTGRGAGIASLGAIALVAAYAFGTQALVPLGVGLVCLPVLAMVLVWAATARLEPTRSPLGGRLRAGDVVRVQSAARLRGRRPVLEGLVVARTEPCAEVLGEVEASGPGETVIRARRGVTTLDPPRLDVMDAFGLARGVRLGRSRDTVLVPPRVVRLPPAAAAAFGRDGGERRAWGAGTDLDRVREYRAGDPLSRVHWAQTAKRGHLQTKVLTGADDRGETIALALDASAAAGADPAFEESVSVVASLAHAILTAGGGVTLVVRDGSGADATATTASRATVDRILAGVVPGGPVASQAARGPARRSRPPSGTLLVTTRAGIAGESSRPDGRSRTIVVGAAAAAAGPKGRARRDGRVIPAAGADALGPILHREDLGARAA